MNKKVLFVSRLFFPSIGGVENHVLNLSKELTKRNYSIQILTTKNSNKLSNSDYINKILIRRIEYPNMKYLGLLYIWGWVLFNFQYFKSFDVIHCHDVIIWLLPLKIFYPKNKIYLTFHGYENYPLKLSSKYMHKIAEYLSDGIISVGKYIQKWYKTRTDLITYGAIDPTLLNKKASLIKNKYLFLGALNNINSVTKYLNPGVKNKIIFVGDGENRISCSYYGQVIGFVNNPYKYISKSEIIFTGGYLSILEAIAMDKPVYAIYDNPLKKDYLMMTPFAKYIRIGKKFDKYLKYKYPKELKEWIKKQTWEKMAQDYIKLWNK